MKVGITGGIGSGKTLVCKIFEYLGVPVFYADDEAKRIMVEDMDVKARLMSLLGGPAYRGLDLDTAYIASKIFRDENLLKKMNAIVHPAVHAAFIDWANRQGDVPYVIEEAALIFESGAADRLDAIVEVYASEDTRIRRVCERDRVDETMVRNRMQHQMDEEEKRTLADHVILNDGNDLILPQIVELHNTLKKGDSFNITKGHSNREP
jgi:dephospho-CoA kinase